MKIATLVVLALVIGSAVAEEQVPACKRNPEIVAPCFTVYGRLSFWNGAPSARIWRVGTNRMLGVHSDILPKGIQEKMRDFDTELWGHFEVCPFTKEQPGHMQFVCIEAWRNVRVRQRE